MKKFFQIVLVFAVVLVNAGCMTRQASYRILTTGSTIDPGGGRVTYARTESYTYDSGYREYSNYGNLSGVGNVWANQHLNGPPPEYRETIVIIGNPVPKWHNIPNPIQGNRDEHHHESNQGWHNQSYQGRGGGGGPYIYSAPMIR